MSYIQAYCTITPGAVCVNGKNIFHYNPKPFVMNAFFSAIYTSLNIDYRKFYKMDALSKLGFLASEILLAGSDREQPKDNTSIVLFNKSSSLEADTNYQQTIQHKDNFFPSPADFVYTLPNIVTGEIAIRNKIHGETAFYVLTDFSPEKIRTVVNDTMQYGRMTCALAGWIEVDLFTNFINCFMMLCTSKSSTISHSHLPVGLKNIYADKNLLFNEYAIDHLIN